MLLATDFSRQGIAKLLKRYGVRVVEESVAKSPKEAERFAGKIGYPVVLKVVSREILHKTDQGCVKVSIMDAHELRAAYAHIMKNAGKAKVEGMLVQKMVKHGIELIVGGRKDGQFGPIILFGLGGIFVEILKDVSIRVCPIRKEEAEEMIGEIKGSPLLHGARGTEHVDTAKIAQLLVNVSRLLYENQEICELDLNPIIAYSDGYLAVDVRVIRCVT